MFATIFFTVPISDIRTFPFRSYLAYCIYFLPRTYFEHYRHTENKVGLTASLTSDEIG